MLSEPNISYKPFWGICRPLNSWRANSPNPIQIYCADVFPDLMPQSDGISLTDTTGTGSIYAMIHIANQYGFDFTLLALAS